MKKQFEDLKKYLTDPDTIAVYILLVIVAAFLFLIKWESSQHTPESEAQHQLALKCMSKSSGSQPVCWDQEDWAAFCEHTNICKNATVK